MKTVIGYCDPWSAAPGERIAFHVSCGDPSGYEAQLVRVVCGDDSPQGPGLDLRPIAVAANGNYPGRLQTHPIGSCALMPSVSSAEWLGSFTISVWCWPTAPRRGRQAILSQWSDEAVSGFSLELDAEGHTVLRLGDGRGVRELRSPKPMLERRWGRIAAGFSAQAEVLFLGLSAASVSHEQSVFDWTSAKLAAFSPKPASVPLTLAAVADPDGGRWHRAYFNGKLARPQIRRGVVPQSLLAGHDPLAPGLWDESLSRLPLIADWDLSLEMQTAQIRDVSGNEHEGVLINLPSRACTGPSWAGEIFDWRFAPEQYDAIHFHDDDLYDAGWDTDFELEVPADLASGYYAMRLRCAADISYVSFFVRPLRNRATAPVAFLASTATSLSYANYRFQLESPESESMLNFSIVLDAEDVYLQEHAEIGLSNYDRHSDGSGVRFVSRLRPILNMGPCTDLWNLNADTHLLKWLDERRQPFDVITDDDLHAEGSPLLERYRCLITGTHPEYWITSMWRALEAFLARGGRLMYLGGNGFYWRIAKSESFPAAIELRRSEGGARYWSETPGEYHSSFTGEYLGLWDRTAHTPESLVGVATRAITFDRACGYRPTCEAGNPRAAFVFHGIATDKVFGDFGLLAGGAAGSEIDAADFAHGTPHHALVLARADDFSRDSTLVPERILMPFPAMHGDCNAAVCAEMVFFETPSGGAVFSVGSVNWCASLPHRAFDNDVARITANVLARFLEDEPFPFPSRASS
jgi:N,N-dimethylformamidase